MDTIFVVCGTKHTTDSFMANTLLGRSLQLYKTASFRLFLCSENEAGLAAVYNGALQQAIEEDGILLFVHDDVALLDFYWPQTLERALGRFDIVGLAGNRCRSPMQPTWGHVVGADADGALQWDDLNNLSGAMAFGPEFPCHIGYFGPPDQECKLLDGLFLAVRTETLRRTGLRFDQRFDFHFYDMDFCRQAEAAGLTMGTCSISALHASPGGYSNPAWHAGYTLYLEKWGQD